MKVTIALLLAPLATALPALPRFSLPFVTRHAAHAPSNDTTVHTPPFYLPLPHFTKPWPPHHTKPWPPHYNGTAATDSIAKPPPLYASKTGVALTDLVVSQTLANNTLNAVEIEYVSFKLNGNTTCSGDYPVKDFEVFTCGPESPYSFGLVSTNATAGTTSFGVKVYKQTSPFTGNSGAGNVDVHCRSGGGNIQICQQVSDNTIILT